MNNLPYNLAKELNEYIQKVLKSSLEVNESMISNFIIGWMSKNEVAMWSAHRPTCSNPLKEYL